MQAVGACAARHAPPARTAQHACTVAAGSRPLPCSPAHLATQRPTHSLAQPGMPRTLIRWNGESGTPSRGSAPAPPPARCSPTCAACCPACPPPGPGELPTASRRCRLGEEGPASCRRAGRSGCAHGLEKVPHVHTGAGGMRSTTRACSAQQPVRNSSLAPPTIFFAKHLIVTRPVAGARCSIWVCCCHATILLALGSARLGRSCGCARWGGWLPPLLLGCKLHYCTVRAALPGAAVGEQRAQSWD